MGVVGTRRPGCLSSGEPSRWHLCEPARFLLTGMFRGSEAARADGPPQRVTDGTRRRGERAFRRPDAPPTPRLLPLPRPPPTRHRQVARGECARPAGERKETKGMALRLRSPDIARHSATSWRGGGSRPCRFAIRVGERPVPSGSASRRIWISFRLSSVQPAASSAASKLEAATGCGFLQSRRSALNSRHPDGGARPPPGIRSLSSSARIMRA